MKRTLFTLLLAIFSIHFAWSQCVTTCSNYVVMPITFTTFPTVGSNTISSFFPNNDDGYTSPMQIGFNFNYYCTTYSTVLIYTNGLIQFDIGAPSTFPLGYDAAQNFPNPNTPTILNGIVAFRMDDLDPTLGGSVTYATIGTAPNRMLVVTYSAVPLFTVTPPTSLLYSGQIVLYETSNMIDIYTINAPLSPNLATQGIENATGSLGLGVPGRNQTNWSGSSDAYRFIPVTPQVPSGIMGNNSLCQGIQSTYSITTQTGALSYNWTVPPGWAGTSTTTALTSTTGISGSLSVTATYTCGTSAATVFPVTVIPAPIVSVVSVDPPVVCSGSNFTITPAGGLSYTLNPGGAVTNSVFIQTASNASTFSLVSADANCKSSNTATTSIIINASPTITVNSGTICDGQQFTITPSGSGADSYNVSGGFLTVTPPSGTYTYQVVGNNSTNGCSSVPVISSLTVNANPSVSVTSVRSIICKGESERLTASGAATYSWNIGQTTSTVLITPAATAQYTVTGTTAAGCSRLKTINIIVAPCTGIESLNPGNSMLSIFPNPSNGIFKLQITGHIENSSIEVFDAIGRLVVKQEAPGTESTLDLTAQPMGLYYVKIKNSGATETVKIVKE